MSRQPGPSPPPAKEILDSDNANHHTIPLSLEDSFFDHLETFDDGIHVYRDVIPEMAERFFQKRNARRQKLQLHYHPWEKALMITIPSKHHYVAYGVLKSLITQQIRHMAGAGVDGWASRGSATFGELFTTTGKGEGNGSGLPASHLNRAWPTLVVEVACSQSTAEVRQKMRWWFMASNHGVKIVLVIILDRAGRQLVIEKYTEEPQDEGLEELDDNTPERMPILQQTITMTPQRRDTRNLQPISADGVVYTRPETEDEQAQVRPLFFASRPATRAAASQRPPSTQECADCVGEPLLLEFNFLFLREPDVELGECNVVVRTQDLASMAGMVFGVDRYPRGNG